MLRFDKTFLSLNLIVIFFKKLSDKDHYIDLNNDNKFEHNADYDHEAFLGKEEADSFRTLTPEESKARLG